MANHECRVYSKPTGQGFVVHIRDRIVDFRRVKASELRPNPRNWRIHPASQRNALQGVLAEVGIVDAVLARTMDDGTLELIDGHLRAETMPDTEVPVLVVDLDDAEAAKVLATFDTLTGLAEIDAQNLEAVLQSVDTSSDTLQQLLDSLASDAGVIPPDFHPVPQDAQSRLDEKAKCKCPECGHEFTP